MRATCVLTAIVTLMSLSAPGLRAAPDTPGVTAESATAGLSDWKPFGNWRLRLESWDWFDTVLADDNYAFAGSLLRIGATRSTPANDITLELSAPTLLGLPQGATAPPPQGQLGLGASYRDGSGSQEVNVFLKQGFIRLKYPSGSLRLGRFEFIDGTESAPSDPTLAWLKRERIAHRVIGNFGWSHIQRSFDGIHYSRTSGSSNLTLFGGFPTRGVFDIRGMDTLSDVITLYAAHTVTRPSSDFRFFGLYYDDRRKSAVKPDNRPLADRQADTEPVRIGTIGAHFLRSFPTGSGTVDGLLWGAVQFGDWGRQDHRGFAGAAEIGFQPEARGPWFRLGIYHAGGDGSPGDDTHSTYFSVLPTPRIYARFPFYTLMNVNDLFGQIILRPNPKVNVRLDAHRLSLASGADAWYAGGGAFNNGPGFGYAARPSGGMKGLATVLDVSADYQIRPQSSIGLYLGHARGHGVIENIYAGSGATFGYIELTHRW